MFNQGERMKTFPICEDCLGNGYVKIDTTKLTTVDNTTTCTVCTGSGHKPDPRDNLKSTALASLGDETVYWC
jgi:DnaJ-class molecular chaperone